MNGRFGKKNWKEQKRKKGLCKLIKIGKLIYKLIQLGSICSSPVKREKINEKELFYPGLSTQPGQKSN
jgi:hypothetical protein